MRACKKRKKKKKRRGNGPLNWNDHDDESPFPAARDSLARSGARAISDFNFLNTSPKSQLESAAIRQAGAARIPHSHID